MNSSRFATILFGLSLIVAALACTLSTPEPPTGSISGVVWHEICQFVDGSPPTLGQGCVEFEGEPLDFGPNQIYDDFETGWAGVTLHLGLGACPSTGLDTTATNAAGEYSFDGLSAGTYCVSYSNLTDGNDTILIPGGPTYPERGDGGFFQTVDVGAGEDVTGVDFGYAWQFFD